MARFTGLTGRDNVTLARSTSLLSRWRILDFTATRNQRRIGCSVTTPILIAIRSAAFGLSNLARLGHSLHRPGKDSASAFLESWPWTFSPNIIDKGDQRKRRPLMVMIRGRLWAVVALHNSQAHDRFALSKGLLRTPGSDNT
jgi:hypothetical protein